jgi:hypothetical protein
MLYILLFTLSPEGRGEARPALSEVEGVRVNNKRDKREILFSNAPLS